MVFGVVSHANGVSPARAGAESLDAYPVVFMASGFGDNTSASVATSYTTTKLGRYQVAAWGAGNYSSTAPGSLAIRTVRLPAGVTIPMQVGSAWNAAGEPDTIVTFPDGVMTAQGSGGAASGGDINVSGVGTVAGTYGGFIGGGNHRAPGGGVSGGLVQIIFLGS